MSGRVIRDESFGQQWVTFEWTREGRIEWEGDLVRTILMRLSSAADGSWGDLKRMADRALKDARKIADVIIKWCRHAGSE